MFSETQINDLQINIVRCLQGGRLTVGSSGESLVWTPYHHGSIALWSGISWELITKSEAVSFYVSENDYAGNSLAYGTNYDVYARYEGNSFSLQLAKWQNNSTRQVEPERFHGILVYNKDTTEGRSMRYLGAARLVNNGGPKFSDGPHALFVANWDYPAKKPVFCYHPGTGAFSLETDFNYDVEYSNGGVVRAEILNIFKHNGIEGLMNVMWSEDQGSDTALALSINKTYLPSIHVNLSHLDQYSDREARAGVVSSMTGSLDLGYNFVTIVYSSDSIGAKLNMNEGKWGGGLMFVRV